MLQWITEQLKLGWAKITVILGVTAVLFCLLFGFSEVAVAQSLGDANSTLNQGVNIIQAPLGQTATDPRLIVARIIQIALGLLGLVFLVLFIYGGFLYMTAGGNEEQIASAKKIFVNAIIGLVIILSAYGIVLFVMRMLGIGAAQNAPDLGGTVEAPVDQNFFGSGGLGSVIKDHYPTRDQKDVARNTKIIITFKKAVSLASFVNDTNNNGTFGDCVNVGANMKWETDCDSLKKGTDLISVKDSATGQEIRGATVLGSIENGQVYTIVIRPFDALGDDQKNIMYTVHIGAGVKQDDAANGNPSIFGSRPSSFYEWQFTTSNVFDTTAPFVTGVYPDLGSKESKNSVIQVNFSEPMDPMGLQGTFKAEGDYFVLDGHTVFLKSGASTVPVGDMQISNGYTTLEFTPNKECGTNACGGKIFCMPVCDRTGAPAACQEDLYQLIVKAAQTFNVKSFEAIPFSGAMDLAGNALDGNHNGVVDAVATGVPLFPGQAVPDNYAWSFTLTDKIDLTAPFLTQVTPGPDANNVPVDNTLSLNFSKRMRVEPMYGITIEEHPAGGPPLCKVPRVTFGTDGNTVTKIDHCPFINTTNHYYFPVVGSEVEDVKFNCFYPGKGPVSSDQITKTSYICDSTHTTQCCAVTADVGNAFCCNGLTTLADRDACLTALRNASPLGK